MDGYFGVPGSYSMEPRYIFFIQGDNPPVGRDTNPTISGNQEMDWLQNQGDEQKYLQKLPFWTLKNERFLDVLGTISTKNMGDTVDGQNPAPPRMMIIPLFIGF